jgi:hypothetical protein
MNTCNVLVEHVELTAHYDYYPGRPGVHTLRNGDPGFPDDPPELEVDYLDDGVNRVAFESLSEEVREHVEQQIIDHEYEKHRAEEVEMYEAWAHNRGIDP